MDGDYEGDNLLQANKRLSSSTWSLNSSAIDTLSGLFKKKSRRLLTTAVAQDDCNGVAAALGDGADPNSCMAWQFTESWGGKINKVPMLIVAVTKGNFIMVTALLKAGAKTEFKGDFKVTPLAKAIAKGHTVIARYLIEHGADVNARSPKSGWLPIHFAAGYDRIKIIEILHEHGVCLCAINNEGRTPLHIAAGWGHKRTTEWLMKQGVDCSAVDYNGRTAADNALSSGHKKLAAWLQEHTFDSSTAVAQLEHLKLDDRISNSDMINSSHSRLLSAVTYGDHLGVKRALDDGADPNACMVWEHKRVPVLTVAASQGLTDVVTALFEPRNDKGRRRVNTEHKGDLPVTPLAEASGRGPGHIIIVKKLLMHGADVNAKDSERGSLPIHFAAANGHVNIAKLLHRYGSSLDVVNKLGQTPLHRAACWGFRPMVEWLLDQHVDVTAEDYEHNTAGDLAESQGHKELASWILSREFEAPSHEYSYPSAPQVGETSDTHRIGEQAHPSPSPNNRIHGSNKKVYIFNFIDFPPKIMVSNGETTVTMNIKRRNGASVDSENLKSTFQGLGYNVNLYENKNAAETYEILDYIQKQERLDFLLLFILSHGMDEHTFIASDGIQLSLRSIQQMFTDSKCPNLEGRTKIIFANFCRGQIVERNLPIYRAHESDFIESDALCFEKEPPRNMITIYSSHAGFESRRSRIRGTAFVDHLCAVINAQPHLPIQDVFNSIHEKMRQGRGATPEMTVSAPFTNFKF